MTLDKYLRSRAETSREFAERGGFSIYAVRKWRRMVRTPRKAAINKIRKLTKGSVTYADWF